MNASLLRRAVSTLLRLSVYRAFKGLQGLAEAARAKALQYRARLVAMRASGALA